MPGLLQHRYKVYRVHLTPEKVQQFSAAQGQLSQALGRLLAVSEAYPNLRAKTPFAVYRRNLKEQKTG